MSSLLGRGVHVELELSLVIDGGRGDVGVQVLGVEAAPGVVRAVKSLAGAASR